MQFNQNFLICFSFVAIYYQLFKTLILILIIDLKKQNYLDRKEDGFCIQTNYLIFE